MGQIKPPKWARCSCQTHHRDTTPPPVPDEVATTYDTNVLSLLNLRVRTDGEGQPQPHVLHLDLDARDCLEEFELWLEPQLAEFGELGTITDWAGKLVGAVGRIAGNLHMAAFAGEHAPWEFPIPGTTFEHAITIGKYLIVHARAAFAEMGADKVQGQATKVLRWIAHNQVHRFTRFTKRDVHQGLKGTFTCAADVDAPLALLETHCFIRKQPEPDRVGAGRAPSPTYDVNPLRASQNTQNTQNSGLGCNFEYFEYFETLPPRSEQMPRRVAPGCKNGTGRDSEQLPHLAETPPNSHDWT